MNQNDFRILSDADLDAISGGTTLIEADVYNIRGKGELEIGTKELSNGQIVPYAKWTPK